MTTHIRHNVRRASTHAAPPHKADWRDQAACREKDTNLFFPVARTRGWMKQTREAKQVCAPCPVREACLKWALETGQRSGVWGGLSAKERKSRYQVKESQSERCWEHQEWIKEQLAKGVTQKDLAEQLVVSRDVMSRVVRQLKDESVGSEGVKVA